MGWGGILIALTSSNYVVFFSLNFQLRSHPTMLLSSLSPLTTLASLVRHLASTLFFLYQFPTTLASVVRHLPSTLFSSLSTSNNVSTPCKTSSKYVAIFCITSNYVRMSCPILPSTCVIISCPTLCNYVVIFSINFQLGHRHCGQLLEACEANHSVVFVQFQRPVRDQQSMSHRGNGARNPSNTEIF